MRANGERTISRNGPDPFGISNFQQKRKKIRRPLIPLSLDLSEEIPTFVLSFGSTLSPGGEGGKTFRGGEKLFETKTNVKSLQTNKIN